MAAMEEYGNRLKPGEISTGTTIMGVEFDGGVVLGADSRTSTGVYVANRVSDKLAQLHDTIWACRSGSAADTQALSDYVRYYLDAHSGELERPPSVHTAATLMRHLCYNNKDNLTAGLIIGGWDQYHGAQVYTIPLGGVITRSPMTIGGSGSTYIYGYCDANFRENMSKEEAKEFVTKAISLALSRDGSSGGVVRLCVITEEGVERETILGNELPYGP